MSELPPALQHGPLDPVFPDVYFVSGTMETVLMGAEWKFSRNMTVVRDGDQLTLINCVRLDTRGLQDLEALGRVANVVKIGSLHGRDDAFYKTRYGATFWAPRGMTHEHGLVTDKELTTGGEMPFAGCRIFEFTSTKLPEAIIHIDRAGGILVACDSLQNWIEPDEYFSEQSRHMMTEMGFFRPANLGPLWLKLSEPKSDDFERLSEFPFKHVLCGHGSPIRDTAKEDYLGTFRRIFG